MACLRGHLSKKEVLMGAMHLDLNNPLNASTPRSLRLEIAKATPGRLAIANEGFWGIGVAEGENTISHCGREATVSAGH